MRLVVPICSLLPALLGALAACGSTEAELPWSCRVEAEAEPDWSPELGCLEDFTALASLPLDSSIPGAVSVKTVIDRFDGEALHFQNSRRYAIHWDFASATLSGAGRPIVPPLAEFNRTEYTSPDRRFVLGALTHYEGPDIWAYEIAPYDTASATMIADALEAIRGATYLEEQILFHPTSDAVAVEAAKLPGHLGVVTTDEVYAGTSYQPLNLGAAVGMLRFLEAAQLDEEFPSYRDIVVLDRVPNDIAVVAGLITAELQTPLSHVNVLSQNRGTPNMGLRGAHEDAALRALEGRWVRLDVGPFEYSVVEVTSEEAESWWGEHRPDAVSVPSLDLEVSELTDVLDILDPDLPLGEALRAAIPAFGGKAAHYAAMAAIGEEVPAPRAFAVPVRHYWDFMEQNGLDVTVRELLEDQELKDDPAVRDLRLGELREAIRGATLDPAFEAALISKLERDFPGTRMRFRSSTNAEDLDGFTGAGLYTSCSGAPGDLARPVADAVRRVWASVWNFRAFEEREYRSIDHLSVGMALLVHRSFPEEEANGVALTANPFDTAGVEPGFYVNVQVGDLSVVQPDAGVTTDQFVYHFEMAGQPIVFITRSSETPEGSSVLTSAQTFKLGTALDAIHRYFRPLYGTTPGAWYAMDVEFKLDGEPGEEPALFVKQARPHPGWGAVEGE